MESRLQLHDILVNILGSNNVYFQPPENHKIEYPCILYSEDSERAHNANNLLYFHKKGYSITVIDTNPDSLIPDRIRQLPLCEFVRRYTSDRLTHTVFNLYFKK